jgi:hypothetical protein
MNAWFYCICAGEKMVSWRDVRLVFGWEHSTERDVKYVGYIRPSQARETKQQITNIERNVNSASHQQQIRRYYSYWWSLMKIEDHKDYVLLFSRFQKNLVLLKRGRKETSLEAGQAEKRHCLAVNVTTRLDIRILIACKGTKNRLG